MAHNYISKFEVFLRNTVFGRFVYSLSRGKYFKSAEEYADYQVPSKYLDLESKEPILVDWDSEDDPQNPQNWPLSLRLFFVLLNSFICLTVYIASAIYTPGIEQIEKDLDISSTVATLPLSLFVIGYGIGPLIFGPLTENAKIGRMPVYFWTIFMFIILQIPTALVKNIEGFCVLRFITGLFVAAPIGVGPAAIADVIPMAYVPFAITFWSVFSVSGPALGPLIGAIFTVKATWRWVFWFLVILNGVGLALMAFFFPEPSSKALLYKKALILRKKTGNENITSSGEIELKHMSTKEVIIDTLWRPFEISIKEPVVLLIHLYISLMYAITYLWFEAFPIVFFQTKKFTLVTMGVTYICIFVGCVIGASVYIPWSYKIFTKPMLNNEMISPEVFLPLTIVGSIIMPIGMFIFGWTSSPEINWFPPILGATLFVFGSFFVFQTLFNYLSMSFFRFLASVFSGNAAIRSIFGGVFPLFGSALFKNTGSERFPVGWGSSILGFIFIGMIAIPVLFYFNGPKLRARSKYAGLGDMGDMDVDTQPEPISDGKESIISHV
ncbi:Cycloheximide resistance protein [Wickerhamomyces ciferrii]|uniref:Cycloheximide resistance protein n=1 Tax=Wickerhamomyces ciferrii (strain ATCC 14091 / BCRC 22168 / CBS 111 / JCM 3599 / NBRC 0793 / NRRL Y-1031 F-60-10) TaxID=1206466 RepID=K0KK31_WICCF|nr:Cycloheximide resistance protein [Wickerhamomyces ciferrii]CCH41819.1 Cycloheximide resistance protein [Wickerhamomyces ciferrii]